MKNGRIFLTALLAALLGGIACAQQTAWITDLDTALSETARRQKDLLLVFTGSDWNEPSKRLIADVFNADFFARGSADYVLCNLDIVQDKNLMDETTLAKNYEAASKYGVPGLPCIVLQTPEGDSYTIASTGDELPPDFLAWTATFRDARDTLVDLKAKIASPEGSDKAIAIDTFLSAVIPSQRERYPDLIRSVPALDPGNKSGLLGKYTLQVAYLDSIALYGENRLVEASLCFGKAIDSGCLDGAQKQEAFYMTAYLLAMSGSVGNDAVVGYLEQAIAADPESSGVAQIRSTIEQIRNAEKEAAAAAGDQGADGTESAETAPIETE